MSIEKIWEPKSDEILEVKMEHTNKMDKFVVAVRKNKKFVRYLPLGKTGRFSKIIFYFLKCEFSDCKVKIADGKAVNLGDGMGMRAPCLLLFRGQSDYIDIFSKELSKNM